MGSSALPVVAAYLLLRTVGKLLGGWIVRRTMPDGLPVDLGLLLVSPGIFGVAFAMNTVRAAGPQTAGGADVVLGGVGQQHIESGPATGQPDRGPDQPGADDLDRAGQLATHLGRT